MTEIQHPKLKHTKSHTCLISKWDQKRDLILINQSETNIHCRTNDTLPD